MKSRLYTVLIGVCIAGTLGLSVLFFLRYEPVSVEIPILTAQLLQENHAQIAQSAQQRQNAEAARKRQALEARMYSCQTREDCVIVDKHPCGCLKGPTGVTAINGSYSLEFSKLMDKQFSDTVSCPSVASTEKECAPSARAICRESRCEIIY